MMIVIIAIAASLFTDQPMDFSDGRSFVFVSAFLAGMLFRRRTDGRFVEARSATTLSRVAIYRRIC